MTIKVFSITVNLLIYAYTSQWICFAHTLQVHAHIKRLAKSNKQKQPTLRKYYQLPVGSDLEHQQNKRRNFKLNLYMVKMLRVDCIKYPEK